MQVIKTFRVALLPVASHSCAFDSAWVPPSSVNYVEIPHSQNAVDLIVDYINGWNEQRGRRPGYVLLGWETYLQAKHSRLLYDDTRTLDLDEVFGVKVLIDETTRQRIMCLPAVEYARFGGL